MSAIAQKRAVRWRLTVQHVRLKLDLARHHVNIPYPNWLNKVEERLLREHFLGIVAPTLMTMQRAREYEDFLAPLWEACNLRFGACLTETLLVDELDAFRRELDPDDTCDIIELGELLMYRASLSAEDRAELDRRKARHDRVFT